MENTKEEIAFAAFNDNCPNYTPSLSFKGTTQEGGNTKEHWRVELRMNNGSCYAIEDSFCLSLQQSVTTARRQHFVWLLLERYCKMMARECNMAYDFKEVQLHLSILKSHYTLPF